VIPTTALAGGVEEKLIVCALSAAAATAKDCCTCGAGW